MKLNIAYPANGSQLSIEITAKEEQRLYGKRIGEQINGALINPEYEGSVFEIVGGNDYQGICMIKNKETANRLRILLKRGDVGYKCRKIGVRKRKTVRGSIISNETQVLNVILVKEGSEIAGLTDVVKDKTHLPKKINKLCEMLGLPENANIMKSVKQMVGEDQKMPKLKIVRKIHKAEIAKREEGKRLRKLRAAKLSADKKEFEKKYGKVH